MTRLVLIARSLFPPIKQIEKLFKRKYSQVAGLFNKSGFNEFMALPPLDDGTFHFGLKGTLGPIPLTGEKSGFDFQAEIEMDWLWQWNNGTQKSTAEVCLFYGPLSGLRTHSEPVLHGFKLF